VGAASLSSKKVPALFRSSGEAPAEGSGEVGTFCSDFPVGKQTPPHNLSLQTAATFFGLVLKNLAGAGDLDPGKLGKKVPGKGQKLRN
jgi:hypothetical protein